MRTRKRVVAVTTVTLAVIAGTVVTTDANAESTRGDRGRVKNVIYLLGDGMGRTHVSAARQRYYGAAGSLAMEQLPVVGQVRTYAVEKLSGQPGEADFKPNYVTDSASAATAWASGVKTYNAALGVDAKARVVPTLMELAKDSGYRTGNVSTAEITDATPAGQMSHVLLRGCQVRRTRRPAARTPASPAVRSCRPATYGSRRSPTRSPATAPPTSSSAAGCRGSRPPTSRRCGSRATPCSARRRPRRWRTGATCSPRRAGRCLGCSTGAT